MTDGVGKRIVDALKKQAEVEVVPTPVATIPTPEIQPEPVLVQEETNSIDFEQPMEQEVVTPEPAFNQQPMFGQQVIGNMYSQPLVQNTSEFPELEVPANVAVLRQLISQLPSGVSRQAGALVIKQTMEALGISMKSVLQEAQQLQETINLSARECQNNILECKKQINTLEAQVHKYQRQAASLNEIVSLFVQLN